MGIWIRSQGKCKLINVNKIEIAEFNTIWGNDILIGKYSTEEKALKVLDEIEKSLIGTITVENIELNKLEILKEELKQKRTISTAPVENLCVFQMPQDNEVK